MRNQLVIKLGTSTMTKDNGDLNDHALKMLTTQISQLHQKYNLVLVSSGSVAAGRAVMSRFGSRTADRKAAAAIGNPVLIRRYSELFGQSDIRVGQILCERDAFSVRKKFLELQETIFALWESNILPIVNENDVTASFSHRFSDNDELATLLAIGLGAKRLMLGTSVDGLLNNGQLVRRIDSFDKHILSLATPQKSHLGLGGMISKLSCAERATRFGVEVIIFNAKMEGNILVAEQNQTGTFCAAADSKLRSYHKWVAGIGLVLARIHVDSGAAAALKNRKSLLGVGIKNINGNFESGEIVEIVEQNSDQMIAIARTQIASQDLLEKSDKHGVVVSHADEIVLVSAKETQDD